MPKIISKGKCCKCGNSEGEEGFVAFRYKVYCIDCYTKIIMEEIRAEAKRKKPIIPKEIWFCKNMNRKRGHFFYVIYSKEKDWLNEKWLGTLEFYEDVFILITERGIMFDKKHLDMISTKLCKLNEGIK